MTAISLEADEVMVKPVDMERVAELLAGRGNSNGSVRPPKEGVANILDRDLAVTIQNWLSRVGGVGELTSILLGGKERSEHIPEMIKNISARLRAVRSIEVLDRPSAAAVAHWLKAAWITFMVLFCIRACFFFVSLGNSGIAITCIFIAGMAIGIWHKTAHHEWPAWWAKM